MKKYKWQDWFLMVISICFGLFLIPQVIDSLTGQTVNIFTSGLTALFLYISAYIYYTLKLRISVITTIFAGTMWLILFILALNQVI